VIDESQFQQFIGQQLRTRDGDQAGLIVQVYLDEYDGQPEWVSVGTGLFGREALVPLTEAEINDGALLVPYTRAEIKAAPAVGDPAALTEHEEEALYQHYNVSFGSEPVSTSPKTPPTPIRLDEYRSGPRSERPPR
jgi:hypothetical protein